MKYRIAFFLFVLSRLFLAQTPLSDYLEQAKQTVLPIVSYFDSTNKQGTAVLLLRPDAGLILTCEHNIALKDSNNVTLKYSKSIYILMNRKDTSNGSIPIKLQLIMADPENDYAILYAPTENYDSSFIQQIVGVGIQESFWKTIDDVKEGESVFYIGYPMNLGVDKQNHPLTRLGIVSQVIPGKKSFLIDGFVQHGHSGSPVFLMRLQNGAWNLFLIGITSAFPKEYGVIFKRDNQKENEDVFTIVNPGFTYVTAMDNIINSIAKIKFIK